MKTVILRADKPDSQDDRKDIVIRGLESGITDFILREEDREFESLGRMNAIYSPEILSVDSPESAKIALAESGKKAYIDFKGEWKIIPLENILSEASAKGISVYAVAHDEKEADIFLNVLERGADGIIVDRILTRSNGKQSVELCSVTVTSIKPAGTGDRVCIDTCSMMKPGEGMLIGSQSNCLLLVQSESEENGYVETRPFRVNAGAVHSYVFSSDRTRYLSELKSGEEIAICDRNGSVRKATVGRCKIESRPMVMVSFASNGKEYGAILQNAETVRLVTADGSVSVTELKEGDMILAKIDATGRHFGMPVAENIREI